MSQNYDKNEIAKGKNKEIEEYIEELILSDYQKRRLLERN